MKPLLKLEIYLDDKRGLIVKKDNQEILICSGHIRDSFYHWMMMLNALFKIAEQYSKAELKRDSIEITRYKAFFNDLHGVNKKSQHGLYNALKGAFSDLEYLYRVFRKQSEAELSTLRNVNPDNQIVIRGKG